MALLFHGSADGGRREEIGEGLIHGAGTVAFGVDGDIEEAKRTQGLGDAIEGVKIEDARKLGSRDFDAGEAAVVTDADLVEAKGMEGGFGLLDLGEIFAGDGSAVLDAGCKAGRGGFVPNDKIGLMSEYADLLLSELSGDQRCFGMVLSGGLLSGAELAAIVQIHTVGDVMEVADGALGLHLSEELIFAVKAALRVVALVVGVGEFRGRKDVGGNTVLGGKGEGGR
jgi:hypothetical protein